MSRFDAFNGDADGLCALLQLRLAEPVDSTLITGVKRDISLVRRVPAHAGDQVDVLDVSLDKNAEAVTALLEAGVHVRYFDHHFPGRIPGHDLLETHIDTTPERGTSLIVDAHLGSRFRAWAVVGTFGDNLDTTARRAAAPLGLEAEDLERLRLLGIYLNYNGYGATVADLHVPPDELFRRLRPYADPLEFMAVDGTYRQLEAGYLDDMARGARVRAQVETPRHALYVLPAEPWARRISGVLANQLAQRATGRAHALLTRLPEGGFAVSVRAPLDTRDGADALCRRFPGGGGRKAAAGVNHLSEDLYEEFAQAFQAAFQDPVPANPRRQEEA